MKVRSLVVAVLLSLCVHTKVHALEPEPNAPLSLTAVVESVERSYPLLRAAALDKDVADADMLSAEGGFDLSWKTKATITPVGYYESLRAESTLEKPTALWGTSAFAGWRLGQGKYASYDGKQETLEYGELRAGVNVPLWRNGPTDRRRANLWRAELGVDIAKLSVVQQQIEFRRAAVHRYWAWVAAGMRVNVAKDLLEIVTSRDAGLAFRVEKGDLPGIERADNARAIAQRKAQLAQAERGLEQASIDLSLYLRDGSGKLRMPQRSQLPKSFPEPPLAAANAEAEDMKTAEQKRPEPRRFKLGQSQNQLENEFARNQLRPGIDLQVAGSADIGANNPLRPDLRQPVVEATVLLDIPLQTRAMQGRADASAAMGLRARIQEGFAKDRVRADVADAHSALRGARLRIDAARSEVSLAQELESAERLRFEQGDSHLLIVNLREQQTAEAELREVDALFDYHRAHADLRAARGE
jgi:outer membrane protein, heavy metal efflux system